tara:strand:- start:479 stop:1396 length:918 start_codon:yes stop_codon:yes gene_type:complete
LVKVHSISVEPFYDERTSTLTYCVYDRVSRDAVIIDPVLDYDAASSTVWTQSVDKILTFVDTRQLILQLVLETHAHADHLSGAQEIKRRYTEVDVCIGQYITIVQQTFKSVFGMPDEFPVDGSQFDRLLKDGETVYAGSLVFKVLMTPGHTPACVSYLFSEMVFTGDALFMPDLGTGRCDFPMGDAETLYRSIMTRLYTLPDEIKAFVGHDYQPGGRALAYETTIVDQRMSNVHVRQDTQVDDFVKLRRERDKTLSPPALLFQSVQINIDAGAMPKPAADAKRFLKIPVNVFKAEHDGKLTMEKV